MRAVSLPAGYRHAVREFSKVAHFLLIHLAAVIRQKSAIELFHEVTHFRW
jgi:hypothetical protein